MLLCALYHDSIIRMKIPELCFLFGFGPRGSLSSLGVRTRSPQHGKHLLPTAVEAASCRLLSRFSGRRQVMLSLASPRWFGGETRSGSGAGSSSRGGHVRGSPSVVPRYAVGTWERWSPLRLGVREHTRVESATQGATSAGGKPCPVAREQSSSR